MVVNKVLAGGDWQCWFQRGISDDRFQAVNLSDWRPA